MKKTFSSFSFGCRVNQAEKEEIDRQLLERGYQWDTRSPSVYIVNTCAVTHKAEREAKQHVYQARKRFPDARIIVTGCAVTNWLKQKESLPQADLLIDNPNKQYLVSLVSRRFEDISKTTVSSPAALPDKFLDSKRIIIKIQDGCQRFCTFCIVPYLRGLPKSQKTVDLITKINSLDHSLKEVILTAINTQAFGYDTKESFIDLVEGVLSKTAIERLSFGSIHPWSIDEKFFAFYEKYCADDRLVDFFHIPLQSGSDKMLKLMKRGYTRGEFMEKLKKIEKLNPFSFIGTDVIVGFYEETDEDFQDTYDFLKETPVSKFHVFRYSVREHTAGFYLKKSLTEPQSEIKAKRAKALISLGKRKYGTFLEKHVGQPFSTLFLQKRKDDLQEGLLSNQIPVQVKTPADKVGQIGMVRIEQYKDGQLFGKMV